jgi:hypothetical protein
MANLKDRIEKEMDRRQEDRSELRAPPPPVRSADPELEAALERVSRGELARAYRTRSGALVITMPSDPVNSPAAPEAKTA